MSANPAADCSLHVGIDCLVVADRPSGVERAVVGLVEGLAQLRPADQRFSLLIAEGREDALPSGPALAPLIAPSWAAGRVGRVAYEQLIVTTRLKAECVDLLHGAAYVLPLSWEGPSVVTIHDSITVCYPEWCQWHNVIHYGMVMTRSALQADAVIVPSEFTRRELVEHVGIDATRVRVAPLGVSGKFAPAPDQAVSRVRERYDLPAYYLLCVGNLEPRKNLAAVIETFDAIVDRVPHHLVIVGKRGWKCRDIIAKMEQGACADRIHWLGWVAHEDLPALYSGADLLIQWSLHEGFGLTPLEAMACGTPAVVSDGGALPEIAGDAARIAPLAGGVDGLAAALIELLEDPDTRAGMSRRGIKHAARYTWAEHARVVSEVYREVADAQI